MTDPRREAVARAIYCGYDEGLTGPTFGTPASWEETAAWPSERAPWYAAADAALAAIAATEPTDAEIEAAAREHEDAVQRPRGRWVLYQHDDLDATYKPGGFRFETMRAALIAARKVSQP